MRIQVAGKEFYKEIIKIGGCANKYDIYVALIDDRRVGYFWGGEGETYGLENGEMYIEYITVIDKKQGIGKQMIEKIFTHLRINKILGETNDDTKGFWDRIGADIQPEYSCDCREMTDFVLLKEKFFHYYNYCLSSSYTYIDENKFNISKLNDEDIERVWNNLSNVPCVEDEEGELLLDEDFFVFKKGTEREDVWKWFDNNHSKGVGYLMNDYEDTLYT